MTALPGIVAYILRTAVVGALIGCGLAILLLATNAAGLGTLIRGTSDPVSPILLLLLGFATLIGSLYTGASIMALPRDKRDAVWLQIRAERKEGPARRDGLFAAKDKAKARSEG